jgi:hypothetical protein
MRKLITPLTVLLLASLSACTEKGPYIIFGASLSRDTTYLATTETPQNHNVLIEEFTGASCPNCPQGHAIIENITSANPGRINSMALHLKGFPQAAPVNGGTYDFRTDAATYIGAHIYPGVNAEPMAGIDRVIYTTGMLEDRANWPTDASTRLSVPNKVNLYVTSNFKSSDTTASIQVKIAYTQALIDTENVTIAIVEDTLYDKQEDGLNTDNNYLFNNILRATITAAAGDPVKAPTSGKEAGRVVISNYNNVKITNIVNPKHCRVIAFVAKTGSSQEVLQSVQTPLAP